ncbi:MAG TPA: hypothetical protein VL225_07805 [Vicinamibacterales bacterium]|jgi:hypothetical protein|nr:hypothetical protein [Vicinamibacterales bacterium]
MMVAIALTLLVGLTQPPDAGFVNGACKPSATVADRPPDDPHADSFASPGATWYANAERTIWAWWWGKTSQGDYKVLWVRPAGARLTVTGRRLDGAAPPLTADIPGGYPWTFQASGVTFPTAGCWEVDASAAGKTMRFVVNIR